MSRNLTCAQNIQWFISFIKISRNLNYLKQIHRGGYAWDRHSTMMVVCIHHRYGPLIYQWTCSSINVTLPQQTSRQLNIMKARLNFVNKLNAMSWVKKVYANRSDIMIQWKKILMTKGYIQRHELDLVYNTHKELSTKVTINVLGKFVSFTRDLKQSSVFLLLSLVSQTTKK
jgi:hypothetical protein